METDPNVVLRFGWPVCQDGYHLVDVDDRPGHAATLLLRGREACVEPRSSKFKPADPLSGVSAVDAGTPLFLHFANLKFSRRDAGPLLDFVNRFGLLVSFDDGQSSKRGAEPIETWRAEVKRFRAAVDAWERGKFVPAGRRLCQVSVSLGRSAPNTRPPMHLAPSNLLDAIWLQFAQFVSSSGTMKTCDYCGRFFGAGGGSGRRADALYCSKEHMVAANNARRAEKRGDK